MTGKEQLLKCDTSERVNEARYNKAVPMCQSEKARLNEKKAAQMSPDVVWYQPFVLMSSA